MWKRDNRIEMSEHGFFFPNDLADEIWPELEFDKRWPNFPLNELRSKGNGDIRGNYETLDALQRLREILNRPIAVASYYRDPAYNRAVGGAEASYHLVGRAVDTPSLNTWLGRAILLPAAGQAGFKGVGLYDTFTHIDTGPRRSWAG